MERYKDPYTGKWRKVSVLMEKDTPRIRKEAQKILDQKISEVLKSEMIFTGLFDQWWRIFYQEELKRSSIASLKGNVKEIRDSFEIDVKVVNIDPNMFRLLR